MARPWSPLPPLRGALVPLLLFAVCLLASNHASGRPSPIQEEGPLTCPAYGASILPAPLGAAATPVAGTLAGSFSVSTGGQANYTFPLVVPPGRLGMEPKLGIGYDSSAGEGMLGVGFALQGLSAVTRCDEAKTEERLHLFSKARAASALTFALADSDAQLHEALYEALSSVFAAPGDVERALEVALQ
jgi:Salmonella virulence plasmid 65kDa B protein